MFQQNTIHQFPHAEGTKRDSLSLIDFNINDTLNRSTSTIKQVDNLIEEGIQQSMLHKGGFGQGIKVLKQEHKDSEEIEHFRAQVISPNQQRATASLSLNPKVSVLQLQQFSTGIQVSKSAPKLQKNDGLKVKRSSSVSEIREIIPETNAYAVENAKGRLEQRRFQTKTQKQSEQIVLQQNGQNQASQHDALNHPDTKDSKEWCQRQNAYLKSILDYKFDQENLEGKIKPAQHSPIFTPELIVYESELRSVQQSSEKYFHPKHMQVSGSQGTILLSAHPSLNTAKFQVSNPSSQKLSNLTKSQSSPIHSNSTGFVSAQSQEPPQIPMRKSSGIHQEMCLQNEISHLKNYVETKLSEMKCELKKSEKTSLETSKQNYSASEFKGRKKMNPSNLKLSEISAASKKSYRESQIVGCTSQIRHTLSQRNQISYAFTEDQRSMKSQRNDHTLFDYSSMSKSIPDPRQDSQRINQTPKIDAEKENQGALNCENSSHRNLFDYKPNPKVERIKHQYLPTIKSSKSSQVRSRQNSSKNQRTEMYVLQERKNPSESYDEEFVTLKSELKSSYSPLVSPDEQSALKVQQNFGNQAIISPFKSFTPVERSSYQNLNDLGPGSKINGDESIGLNKQLEAEFENAVPLGEHFFESGSYRANEIFAQFGFEGPKKVLSETVTVSKGQSSQNQDLISYVVSRRQGNHRASQYLASNEKMGISFHNPSLKRVNDASESKEVEKERFSNKTQKPQQINHHLLSHDFKQRISGIEFISSKRRSDQGDLIDSRYRFDALGNSNQIQQGQNTTGFDSLESKISPDAVNPSSPTQINHVSKKPTKNIPSKQLDSETSKFSLNCQDKFDEHMLVQPNDLERLHRQQLDFSSLELNSGIYGISPKFSKEQEMHGHRSIESNVMLMGTKPSNQLQNSRNTISQMQDQQSVINQIEDEYYMGSNMNFKLSNNQTEERLTVLEVASLMKKHQTLDSSFSPKTNLVSDSNIQNQKITVQEFQINSPNRLSKAQLIEETPKKSQSRKKSSRIPSSDKKAALPYQKSQQVVSTEFQMIPSSTAASQQKKISNHLEDGENHQHRPSKNGPIQIKLKDTNTMAQGISRSFIAGEETQAQKWQPDFNAVEDYKKAGELKTLRRKESLTNANRSAQIQYDEANNPYVKTSADQVSFDSSIAEVFQQSPISDRNFAQPLSPRFNPLEIDISNEVRKNQDQSTSDRSLMKSPVLKKTPERTLAKIMISPEHPSSRSPRLNLSQERQKSPTLLTTKRNSCIQDFQVNTTRDAFQNPLNTDLSTSTLRTHRASQQVKNPSVELLNTASSVGIECYIHQKLDRMTDKKVFSVLETLSKDYKQIYETSRRIHEFEMRAREKLAQPLKDQELSLVAINQAQIKQGLEKAVEFSRRIDIQLTLDQDSGIKSSAKLLRIFKKLINQRLSTLKVEKQFYKSSQKLDTDSAYLEGANHKQEFVSLGERTRSGFCHPQTFFHSLMIVPNDKKVKLAKKYHHCSSIFQSPFFFRLESQTKEEVLLQGSETLRFIDDAGNSRTIKIDVDRAAWYQKDVQKSGEFLLPKSQ